MKLHGGLSGVIRTTLLLLRQETSPCLRDELLLHSLGVVGELLFCNKDILAAYETVCDYSEGRKVLPSQTYRYFWPLEHFLMSAATST